MTRGAKVACVKGSSAVLEEDEKTAVEEDAEPAALLTGTVDEDEDETEQ